MIRLGPKPRWRHGVFDSASASASFHPSSFEMRTAICLVAEPSAPGGGAKIENSSRRHPRKPALKLFLVMRPVLAGKWGGLFLVTSF